MQEFFPKIYLLSLELKKDLFWTFSLQLERSNGHFWSEGNSGEEGVAVAGAAVGRGKILLTRKPGIVKSCRIFSTG